jgi:glutathione S-transferase
MLELYDYLDSGNGYKIRLLLAHLALPYRHVELDIMRGETRTAQFLAINPNGRIPVLGLGGGQYVTESDAILWYLAEGTSYLPDERYERAQVLQWMFFEQYSHEPFIATVRFWRHFFDKLTPLQELELPGRMEKGYAALGVMEKHLGRHEYFVGGRYGLADIALYGYTHVAAEGSFDLDPYPHVCAWLARVAAQPGHVTIDHKNCQEN